MPWSPGSVEDEADRLTRAGDGRALVALLDAEAKSSGYYRSWFVWEYCKTNVLKGVCRSFTAGTHGFHEQVLRALMQYASPMGHVFGFDRRAQDKGGGLLLVWGLPSTSGQVSLEWAWEADHLEAFAIMWEAEQARWSARRAAWVAAVVCK